MATFGLVFTIVATQKARRNAVAMAVGPYITAAYRFTASTSFANPAVTIARGLSDTFCGIRPLDVPMFVAAQCGGAVLAWAVCAWLPAEREPAAGLPAGEAKSTRGRGRNEDHEHAQR